MNWARVSSVGIAVAVALVIIANAPPVLTDPLALAVAQIRVNTAKTPSPVVTSQQPLQNFEVVEQETSEPKKAGKSAN